MSVLRIECTEKCALMHNFLCIQGINRGSGVRGQVSEVRCQGSRIRGQRAEVRDQESMIHVSE